MWRNRLAFAIAVALSPPALAADQIGVVLMHGKQSAPGRTHETLPPRSRTPACRSMCRRCAGPARRIYDRAYRDCLREIDAAIARLKQKGATAFVVAGHSLGANGALGYGADRPRG